MKIKTKSGFECNINERRLKDWRYIKAAAKINSGNEDAVVEAIAFAIPFILGEDGEAALMAHVEDKGAVDGDRVVIEFLEITRLAGEKIKKSQSSLNS